MKRALCPVVVLLGMAGCDGGKVAVPAASPTVEAPLATAPRASPEPSGAAAAGEGAALSVIVGRMELVTGARPMVDKWLVEASSFEERFGADWRKELRDRRVRVTGREHVHVCAPEEECLSYGEVRRLLDVRMIEICASPDLSFTMGRTTVPCPPTKAEEGACVAACSEESKACNQSGSAGPGPRRCGCAMVVCEESCERSGEVDFRCH